MALCPHCTNQHDNSMEETLCPLRPEQIPLMVEQFGPLGRGEYRVTDRLRYVVDDGSEHTGVVMWLIAPNESGSNMREKDEKLRYVIERDGNRMIEEIYDAIYQAHIVGHVEQKI